MKRKLFLSLLSAWALVYGPFLTSMSGQWGAVLAGSVPVGGTPTYYESNGGAADGGDNSGGDTAHGARITVGQSGTATKVGLLLYNAQGTENIKVAIYDNAGTPVLLLDCGVVVPTGGAGITQWYDFTISLAVTNGTTYQVWAEMQSASSGVYFSTLQAGNTGFVKNSISYASFPPGTMSGATSGWSNNYRLYVQ